MDFTGTQGSLPTLESNAPVPRFDRHSISQGAVKLGTGKGATRLSDTVIAEFNMLICYSVRGVHHISGSPPQDTTSASHFLGLPLINLLLVLFQRFSKLTDVHRFTSIIALPQG